MSNRQPEMDLIAGTEDGIRVRYDYDKGEEQWFDARAGVGSPGYPASVEITEVCIGGAWGTPDQFPQLDIDACEQELMEKLAELEGAEEAERADAESADWQLSSKYGKEML